MAACQAKEDRLARVQAKGYVTCGVRDDTPGFAFKTTDGKYTGFEADLCRALAASLFGTADAVHFKSLDTIDELKNDSEIDVVFHGLTWSYSRDLNFGLTYSTIVFYDGQGFLVPKTLNARNAEALSDRTICVTSASSLSAHLERYFQSKNLMLRVIPSDSISAAISAFFAGGCEAVSGDASMLASALLARPEIADQYEILPERFSKEPLAGVVRAGDDRLLKAFNWTVYALIQAEEFGITAANADAMAQSPNPNIAEFLDLKAAAALGQKPDWVRQTIRQVGNFGEIYERNIGSKRMARGENALVKNGGLLYAPPFSLR